MKNEQKLVTHNIVEPVDIKTERLTITEIKTQDKQRYFELYTDENLNRFWGYDYNEDLKGKNPSPDYFFDFQNELKGLENEFAFAVRLNGEMIGELVLYNPTQEKKVEIGFRFFEKFHGKGYAVESAKALIDYAYKTLGASKIGGRCMKENLPSKALFLRLGFSVIKETKTHYFFELK